MYIKEVREDIKKYSRKDLEQLVVELYKQIPKAKREEHQTDKMITDMHQLKVDKKKAPPKRPFADLAAEIHDFIVLAKEQYYFKPNRLIPKKERSNWRFTVINFVKELDSYTPSDPNYAASTDLFIDLYEILSYASAYWTFVSDEPFAAIKITQREFIEKICLRLFHKEYNEMNIERILTLVLESPTDRESLTSYNLEGILSHLSTNPVKELTLEVIDRLLNSYKKHYQAQPQNSNEQYQFKYYIQALAEFYLRIQIDLSNVNAGIAYFNTHYPQKNSEIKLFIILSTLESFELYEPYVATYEAALKKRIKPRDELVAKFNFYQSIEKIDSDAFYKNGRYLF